MDIPLKTNEEIDVEIKDEDLRTECETSDVNAVMDGHLQPFIEAWLQMKAK